MKSRSRDHLEKQIEKRVLRAFPEAIALKTHVRNWPDRVLFFPGGIVLFVEFKRRNEALRPTQALAAKELREQGFVVLEIDDFVTGIEEIRHALQAIWLSTKSH